VTESRTRGRVGVISLGCAKNLVDTEIILGALGDGGFEITADIDSADTVIVNTCGFIDAAKQESVDTILEVAERRAAGSVKRLLVAGCMVNRYGQELAAEIPEIDGFIGLDQLREASELVSLGGAPPPAHTRSHRVFDHTAPRLLTTRGYAYLKVAEGCNNPCTFCAIPVWRGNFRSRTIESLVAEAQGLEALGINELILLAQDTTRYGEDLGLRRDGLERLVSSLLEETTIPWIRFLYAYPTTLDDGLLQLMAREPRCVPYLDIPLQHSHPEILAAMRRGGSAQRYIRLLERARDLIPEIAVRTTFIVGFPGEGEAEFEHLLAFVDEARFDHLGAFVYSPETDTPSSALPGRPARRVAAARRRRLLAAQEKIALESRQRYVGRVVPMLIEGVCEESEHLLQARHAGMAPGVDGRVLINDGLAPVGSIVEVEVTEAYADDLVGHIVGPVGVPGVVVAEAQTVI
jgi:ribosomal protein S12 methylthiotransferase